jgi:hypothetical protein
MRVGVRVQVRVLVAASVLLLCHCANDDQGAAPPATTPMAGAPAAGMMLPVVGLPAGAGAGGTGGIAGAPPTTVAGGAGNVAPIDAGAAPSTPDARVPIDAGPATPNAANPDAAEPDAASEPDAGAPDDGAGGRGEDPPLTPVYRIALRVHRGNSALDDQTLLAVLDEMNWIWWSQAAVCFEIEVVDGDQTIATGFDIWFHEREIPCSPGANGVYCGDHDIHTLDRPSLGAADNAEWDTERNPSRTSAHELGHGLNLDHYNGFADSNDSLMSSGRQGFKLHDAEIQTARTRARTKGLADTTPLHCTPLL